MMVLLKHWNMLLHRAILSTYPYHQHQRTCSMTVMIVCLRTALPGMLKQLPAGCTGTCTIEWTNACNRSMHDRLIGKASDYEVAPGAFPVGPSISQYCLKSDSETSNISSYDSTREFMNEESKLKDGASGASADWNDSNRDVTEEMVCMQCKWKQNCSRMETKTR